MLALMLSLMLGEPLCLSNPQTVKKHLLMYSGMDPLNRAVWGSHHGFKPFPTTVVGLALIFGGINQRLLTLWGLSPHT